MLIFLILSPYLRTQLLVPNDVKSDTRYFPPTLDTFLRGQALFAGVWGMPPDPPEAGGRVEILSIKSYATKHQCAEDRICVGRTQNQLRDADLRELTYIHI